MEQLQTYEGNVIRLKPSREAFRGEVERKLAEADADWAAGRVLDADESMRIIWEKIHVRS